MTWYFNGKEFTSDDINGYVGFVYEITNLDNNKSYIGQKMFYKTIKMPPLKGKARKRKKIVETDWSIYTGSSKKLNDDINNGASLSKTILKLCTSKASLTYYELKYQLDKNSLFCDNYYNEIINVRLNSVCANNIKKDNL